MELNSNETPKTSEVINMALESKKAPKSNESVMRPKFKPRPGFYEKWRADTKRNEQYRKREIQAVDELIKTLTEEELTRIHEEDDKRDKAFSENFAVTYQNYLQSNGYQPSEEHLLDFIKIAAPKSELSERRHAIASRIEKEEGTSSSEEGMPMWCVKMKSQ